MHTALWSGRKYLKDENGFPDWSNQQRESTGSMWQSWKGTEDLKHDSS